MKFNLNRGLTESNTHDNGKTKAWISLNNRTFYSDNLHYLSYIDATLGLVAHNVTSIDLALDTPFNVSNQVKRLIRDKHVTTMLNGKLVKDRDKDRPEISYTLSGSLNRDKYMTVNIKQKKAIRDKAKGTTIISYDKEAEIRNSSGKDYILAYYGNPTKLYRTEVHLNYEQIKEYFQSQENDWKRFYGFLNDAVREELFFHHLNSVIQFRKGKKHILWEQLLGRESI
ncbi:hypothetical protein D0T50_11545 [Bacteroides sp. 214]|nr:hypothetical protein [Bacteroides sp. 214]